MICPKCAQDLPPEAYPRNRTGACLICHAQTSREAYRTGGRPSNRQRAAVAVAEAIIAAEEAVAQLWSLYCPMCGWELEIRRRATAQAFTLAAKSVHCRRCGSGCWASLVSGPATLAAAQAEVERVTGAASGV